MFQPGSVAARRTAGLKTLIAQSWLNRSVHPPWQVLADTLLQREALVCRLGDGVLPHDFAGLYVGAEEVDRILRGLPGLRRAGPDAVGPLLAGLAPAVAAAREPFAASPARASELARVP